MAKEHVQTYILEMEDRVSQALRAVDKDAAELKKELDALRKEQDRGRKADQKRAERLKSLRNGLLLTAAGAAAVGAAFGKMATSAVKTSASLESFETRLGGLLGGLDKGKARVQELFELSARTPFQIQGLVEADATLEGFGVNASRVRGGVLDLAGAMGMDVTEAANAVGKALAGGAGAADVLRDKGVLAMVEMEAGMSTAKMSTEQFRQALVNTLETNSKLAGGTERLAQTYSGLVSTLSDQWTIFTKQVGDAELFSTAKATLKTILDLLAENKAETTGLANIVGNFLAKAMINVVDLGFKIAATFVRMQEGGQVFKQIWIAIKLAIVSATRSLAELLDKIPGLDLSAGIAIDTETIGQLNREFAATADVVDALRDKQEGILDKGSETVEKIRQLADQYQRAANAAGETAENSNEIMTMSGVDKKGEANAEKQAKKAEKDAKNLQKFEDQIDKLGLSFGKNARATQGPIKQSEKLTNQLAKMQKDFTNAGLKAVELGPSAIAAFDKVKGGMIASMKEIEAAIPKAQRQEKVAQVTGAIGGGMSAAAGAMQDGGLGLLASAGGPMGAGAAALIGVGQAGEAEYQSQVEEAAQEIAKERQANLQKQADKLKQAGASEQALAMQGLSAQDIAAAGQVTEADKEEAEEGIDRDQVMADMITQQVESVITGIKAIAQALPEILSALIPMFLVELPTALIEMIPTLIEELIPVLLVELPLALLGIGYKLIPRLLKMLFMDLPVALFDGVSRAFNSIWSKVKKFFADLFDFGIFHTGTSYVPKTGMALLSQGERVIPASGAATGTSRKGLAAFNAGGTSLVINTMTMSPDAVPDLGRLIDAELGAAGRTTVPIFGNQETSREM